jgi:hypothetical protein
MDANSRNVIEVDSDGDAKMNPQQAMRETRKMRGIETRKRKAAVVVAIDAAICETIPALVPTEWKGTKQSTQPHTS